MTPKDSYLLVVTPLCNYLPLNGSKAYWLVANKRKTTKMKDCNFWEQVIHCGFHLRQYLLISLELLCLERVSCHVMRWPLWKGPSGEGLILAHNHISKSRNRCRLHSTLIGSSDKTTAPANSMTTISSEILSQRHTAKPCPDSWHIQTLRWQMLDDLSCKFVE